MGTLRVQWKWNSKRAVSVTEVHVFSCDVRNETSCRSLRSASLCQGEIFLSHEAEGACAGWSMENLIWTQRPDRSGVNEVGFPDGHGDWGWWKDASSRRYYRPASHTGYARTYARSRSAGMKGISKRKYEVIRIGYRLCSYIHRRR